MVVCVVILWLGGCVKTVTAAKKYPISALPSIEWQVSPPDKVSIKRKEFLDLSEWIINAEHTIKKYERQIDMFNDSSD